MNGVTKTFSENLKVKRKEKGLTQENLAQAGNISTKTISAWEGCGRGKNEIHPDLENAVNVAKSLNTSLDYLCGLTKSPEIGLEREITDLGDVIKLILQIAEFVPIYADTPERRWTSEEQIYRNQEGNPYPTTKSTVLRLVIDDARLADFVEGYLALKQACEKGHLATKIFDEAQNALLAQKCSTPIRRLTRRAGLLSINDSLPSVDDPNCPPMRELLCNDK